jgi:phosphoribosylaminoimidazole (AIR) synthetase
MDYKQAGVDIEEGYRAVTRYRELSAQTEAAGAGAVRKGRVKICVFFKTSA